MVSLDKNEQELHDSDFFKKVKNFDLGDMDETWENNPDEQESGHSFNSSECERDDFRLTDIVPKYQVSYTSVKDLKRINLNELTVNRNASGTCVAVKILQIPQGKRWLTTIVEGDEGLFSLFAIRHFMIEVNEIEVEDRFAIGTRLILKEPFMYIHRSGDSLLFAGSPSDMVMVMDDEGRSNFDLASKIDSESILQRAESLLKNSLYRQAYYCFASLLAKETEERTKNKLTVNMMECRFEGGFLDEALGFAEKILADNPNHKKAIEITGRCYHGLKRYEEAVGHLEKCLEELEKEEKEEDAGEESQASKKRKTDVGAARIYIRAETDKNAKKAVIEDCLEESRILLKQKRSRSFDKAEMSSIITYGRRKPMLCESFLGPIELDAERKWSERNMVAKRDIEPGTLLLQSKAIAFSWLPVHDDPDEPQPTWEDVLSQLVQLLEKNFDTYGKIIINEHWDGESEVQPPLYCKPLEEEEPIIDVKQIEKILRNNVFGNDGRGPSLNPTDTYESGKYTKGHAGLGFFPNLGRIKRSQNLANADLREYNDVVIVKATMVIKKQEKVFLYEHFVSHET